MCPPKGSRRREGEPSRSVSLGRALAVSGAPGTTHNPSAQVKSELKIAKGGDGVAHRRRPPRAAVFTQAAWHRLSPHRCVQHQLAIAPALALVCARAFRHHQCARLTVLVLSPECSSLHLEASTSSCHPQLNKLTARLQVDGCALGTARARACPLAALLPCRLPAEHRRMARLAKPARSRVGIRLDAVAPARSYRTFSLCSPRRSLVRSARRRLRRGASQPGA